MDPATYFTSLARYNVWATQRLLDAVLKLTDDEYRSDAGLFFKSVHGTLNHLLVGEHLIWFRRFSEGVSPKESLDREAEPERQRLAKALFDGASQWEALIQGWPAERFAGPISYTTTRGTPVQLPFAATLGHVFNHGTHHRGQITAALTAFGQPAPNLDWVALLQQQAH